MAAKMPGALQHQVDPELIPRQQFWLRLFQQHGRLFTNTQHPFNQLSRLRQPPMGGVVTRQVQQIFRATLVVDRHQRKRRLPACAFALGQSTDKRASNTAIAINGDAH